MKIPGKVLITVALAILIIAVVIAVHSLNQLGRDSNDVESQVVAVKESVNVSDDLNKVELLYFHRTDRCTSCNNAEQYIRDTLDRFYTDEMKSGRLSLQSIDYQKDMAMAFKYNVKMQGLKSITTNGNQTNVKDVPEIWSYVGDKEAFIGFMKSVLDKELGK